MSAQCPRWTSPDGRCSNSDAGDGQHCCQWIDIDGEDVHTTCGCPCGAQQKRPMSSYHASVTVDEKGHGRVMIGPVDLTNHVSAGFVEFKAMHETRITVELPVASLVARGEIELDEQTAKALEALGWSGPDTELLRRRDLQEALGGLGTVLREWDVLLHIVREVATVDECMISNAGALVALAVLLDLPATAGTESIEAKVRELQAKAGEQP